MSDTIAVGRRVVRWTPPPPTPPPPPDDHYSAWVDLLNPPSRVRSRRFKDAAAVAVDQLMPEMLAQMALEPDKLDDRFQRPFWRLAEQAHGKPVAPVAVAAQLLIKVDLFDE